jgi:type II secretory pathway predicted ATPase ExeA
MYETCFGFNKRPFSPLPRTEQYFAGETIAAARQTLARCIERGEGIGVAIGPSGTGKTVLCQMLAEQFRDTLRTVVLSKGRLTARRAILQAILYELKQPYRGMDEGELRLALIDYISHSEECRGGVLLLVDEAHTFSLRMLDEIRMLTEPASEGQPQVRLVLVGSSALEERLASPKIESLSQRIVARCYLEPLSCAETQQYIYAQIGAVGGQGEQVFPAEACQAVHRATDGVPRLINQLCDHALLLAFVGNRPTVEAPCVEEAWADLQQLPAQRTAEKSAPAEGDATIEFGGLDDDSEETAAQAVAADSSTLPRLRVASGEEDAPGAPLAHLRRLEDSIAALDEEFQPAGSIEPEVELVFTDPGNPFSESFAEEEVVVDPAAGRSNPVKDPLWQTAEAQRAPVAKSSPLRPSQTGNSWPPASNDVPLSAMPWNVPLRPDSEVTAWPPSRGFTAAYSVLSERDNALSRGVAQRREAAANRYGGRLGGDGSAWSPVSWPHEPSEEASATSDDADMIIVEENGESPGPIPARVVTPVCHQEYRRLFARLRHSY